MYMCLDLSNVSSLENSITQKNSKEIQKAKPERGPEKLG